MRPSSTTDGRAFNAEQGVLEFFFDEDIWRDEKSSYDPIGPYFETESVVYLERRRKGAKADCQWDGFTHCIV